MRLRRETGFTLIEVMVGMTLAIVVLTATLDVFDSFATTNQRNLTANDMRETARMGVDALALELRNAGAGPDRGSSVERARSDDLVFEDVDPTGGGAGAASVRRVRYCHQETTLTTGRLWRQEADWSDPATNPPPAAPPCPDAFYGAQKVIAEGVVNHAVQRDGENPPIFTYDSPDLNQVTTIAAQLFVDTDIDRAPGATNLNTSVRVRNRNRPPTAQFTPSFTGNRHVLLNAGSSSDPEGQQLQYSWSCQRGGVPCPYNPLNGQVVDFQVATTGTYTFTLTVTDPGNLTSTTTQDVVIPS